MHLPPTCTAEEEETAGRVEEKEVESYYVELHRMLFRRGTEIEIEELAR